MEGLLNIYQALRLQPSIPFVVAAVLVAPLLFKLKMNGHTSWIKCDSQYMGACVS